MPLQFRAISNFPENLQNISTWSSSKPFELEALSVHRRWQGPPVDKQTQGDEHANLSDHFSGFLSDGLRHDRICWAERLRGLCDMLAEQHTGD